VGVKVCDGMCVAVGGLVGVSVRVGSGEGVWDGVEVGVRVLLGDEVGLAAGSAAEECTVATGRDGWQAVSKAMETIPTSRSNRRIRFEIG